MEEKYIESMKKIHNKLFKFLVKFDEVSKIHDVKYHLVGGAAIGALREGDFLEWDDDLDIIIKEEDISKFRKIDWTKYGWSFKNDIRKRHCWITKLYIQDTKIKSDGIDDILWIDIFIGFKQRKIGKIKRLRMLIIDYIMYIKSYRYKQIAKEYGQIWRLVKFIFSLFPFSLEFLARRFEGIIRKSKIVSTSKRKFYVGYDEKIENNENHYLLEGDEFGYIRGKRFPVPRNLRETTKPVFEDIMIPPKKIPQKPDHNIEIL